MGLLSKLLRHEEEIDEIEEHMLESMRQIEQIRFFHQKHMPVRLENTIMRLFKEERFTPDEKEVEEISQVYNLGKVPEYKRIRAATWIAEMNETDAETFRKICQYLKLNDNQARTALESAIPFLIQYYNADKTLNFSAKHDISPDKIRTVGESMLKKGKNVSMNAMKDLGIGTQEEINKRYLKDFEEAIKCDEFSPRHYLNDMKKYEVPRERVLEVIMRHETLSSEAQKLLFEEFPEYKRAEKIRRIDERTNLEKITKELQLTPTEQEEAATKIIQTTMRSPYRTIEALENIGTTKKYLNPNKSKEIISDEVQTIIDSDESASEKIEKIEKAKKIVKEFFTEKERNYLEDALLDEERICIAQDLNKRLRKVGYETLQHSSNRGYKFGAVIYYSSLDIMEREEIKQILINSGFVREIEKVIVKETLARKECLQFFQYFGIESKAMKKMQEINELVKA
jgi:hypothetical protein